MKKIIIVIALALTYTSANAGEWTGNVNFFLGQKTLDKDDWEPLDKQPEFGVLIDFKQQDWPVSIAIDLLGSSDETTFNEPGFGNISIEAQTSELNLGVRKIWNTPNSSIRPYIGGGLALINAEIGATGFIPVSDNDNGTGFWFGGGIYWTLNQSFNIGLDLRYSQADVTLFDESGDAGGTHAGLMLGYHW
ncbi:hypothetical protein MNBD_GAMMA06-1839 [hydrothermal vent metagenome]|uniref:Outer membrane protein beta-barrel domain-containing protein n=1 Tax=hydrothermal vent metagenome TaxID=652676 RepID=A0A3B0WHK3_9ZZZZ